MIFCRRIGHTKEKCYKLHGYPLGHKLYKGPNQFTLSHTLVNQIFASSTMMQSYPFTPEQCQQILALINT